MKPGRLWLTWALLAATPAAFGGDESLRDALQSDTALKDVSSQVESLAGDMDASNVFTPETLASNRAAAVRLLDIRRTDMQAVLRALERSLQEPTNQAACLLTAQDGDAQIARELAELSRRFGRPPESAGADALALARSLSQSAESLARDSAPESAEQQQKADDLARDIRAASDTTANDDARQNMAQAAAELLQGRPRPAADEMKKAVAALEQQSGSAENKLAAEAAREDALKKAADQLAALARESTGLAQNPDTAKAAEKAMDLMMTAEQTAQALDREQSAPAAEEARTGENKLGENQFAEAAKAFQSAADKARAEANQLAGEIQKSINERNEARERSEKAAERQASLQEFKNRVDGIAGEYDEAKQAADKQGADKQDANAPGPEERQKLAAQLEPLGKDLQSAGLDDAAQDVGEAGRKLKSGEGAQARKDLAAASAKLGDALQAMASSPPSGQPGQEAGVPVAGKPSQAGRKGSESSSEMKAGTAAAAEPIQPQVTRGWNARLPPNERQALLSGQQEKCLPIMDDEAKRYFETLSK